MKLLFVLLEWFGIIDCAHVWSKWSLDSGRELKPDGTIMPEAYTGKQVKTCARCDKIYKEYI